MYDDNIRWSYMMIIHDDHIWWSYMMIIWESSGSHLGVIWGSSGRQLGVIWESFGNHLGSIWETSGRMEAEEASGSQISYYVPHSRTECKSSITILILRCVFEGTINYGCIFTARSARRQRDGSRAPCKAPLPRPWEPLQLKTVWGIQINKNIQEHSSGQALGQGRDCPCVCLCICIYICIYTYTCMYTHT